MIFFCFGQDKQVFMSHSQDISDGGSDLVPEPESSEIQVCAETINQ